MSHTRLLLAALIIGIILAISFIFSVPHTQDVPSPEAAVVEARVMPSVSLRDVFKKGVHTITGTVLAPNVCANVSADGALVGDASSTQAILVTVSMLVDTDVCLQVPTKMNFSVTVAAPAGLPLTASVNGEAASTTVL